MASPAAKRKNSPVCTEPFADWPMAVKTRLKEMIETNRNSKGAPYLVMVPFRDAPPALAAEQCWNPARASKVTVCHAGVQYQRPLHKVAMWIADDKAGRTEPANVQASHLCPDDVNVDGKGEKHCCNPAHMCWESDIANKSRQRCAGWIWVHQVDRPRAEGHWFPSCTHVPPCLTFTPKGEVPTLLVEFDSQ